MFERHCEGLCPQCMLDGKPVEMVVNRGDVFECPACRLLVSLASPMRAAILRRRGRGDLRGTHPRFGGLANFRREFLVREDPDNPYLALDYQGFASPDELRAYLAGIEGQDEGC
jgi:hypothetical protein